MRALSRSGFTRLGSRREIMIKAIVIEPGKKPVLAEVKNELKEFQRLVGGYIQTITFGRDIVICNEDGRLLGLEPCATVHGVDFVGTIVIVGRDGEEFTDVTENAWRYM